MTFQRYRTSLAIQVNGRLKPSEVQIVVYAIFILYFVARFRDVISGVGTFALSIFVKFIYSSFIQEF